jgi:23S rRNA C2498 (ribose-2'-O)-methylase RlmM
MKKWQEAMAKEDLLLEINTLMVEMRDTPDAKELLRLSRELTLCLEVAEKHQWTYVEEDFIL